MQRGRSRMRRRTVPSRWRPAALAGAPAHGTLIPYAGIHEPRRRLARCRASERRVFRTSSVASARGVVPGARGAAERLCAREEAYRVSVTSDNLRGRRMAAGLFSNHVVSVLISVITLAFAASILQQSRPVGTTFAWLLVVCLVPYVGIPLYLAFGGRKFQRLARSKPRLPAARERVNGPFEIGGLGVTTSVESVEWISDGVAAYQAFVDEIQNARVSIRITTFLIGDDETGRTLVEALAKRAAEGLAVHLLVDDILWSQVPKAHIARLRTSGGHVHRFMPLLHMPFRGRSNLRNHRKIAVFDGERAIV